MNSNWKRQGDQFELQLCFHSLTGDKVPVFFRDIDSNSVFFILLHHPSAYFITFIRTIAPALRTSWTANEKSHETPITPLDAVSALLAQTRLSSFILCSARISERYRLPCDFFHTEFQFGKSCFYSYNAMRRLNSWNATLQVYRFSSPSCPLPVLRTPLPNTFGIWGGLGWGAGKRAHWNHGFHSGYACAAGWLISP